MKKHIFIVLVVSSLLACGGSGGEDAPPNPIVENNIPSIPSLVNPVDNLLCIDNTVTFNWGASLDLDGDLINYTIQVSKDNQFSQIVHDVNITKTSITLSLDKGKAYYWRVKATDSSSDSSNYSSIFQFYTEGEASENHLPFLPNLVAPELSSVVQTTTTTLQWTASDVDQNDILSFDVYFGTENPPLQKTGNNLSETVLNVEVETSKVYYWKVVVKDSNGSQTIGQVWNFKTD